MLKNSYTDAPSLQPNLILGSLHLLFWLVFHPSAWCNFIARIDPGLSPNFTLADLNRMPEVTAALWRLFVQGYVVIPLLVGVSTGLTLWLQGAKLTAIVTPTAYTIFLSLAIGLIISATIGVAAGIGTGAGMGIAVGVIGSLNIPGDVAPAVIVSAAMGVAIGAGLSIAGNLAGLSGRHKQGEQQRRAKSGTAIGMQVGGIVVGIVVGIGITTLIRFGLTAAGNLAIGLPQNTAYWLSRIVIVGGSFGLAVGWRSGFKIGLIGAVVAGLAYGLAVLGTQTRLLAQGGFLIESGLAIGAVSGLLFGTSFGVVVVLPFVLAEQLAGVWAGAWAGALGSLGRHIFRNQIALWPALPLGFGGTFLGMTLAWWRPVVFYPLLAAWNLILFRLDERRNGYGRRPRSLLRWHSVFWDELQRLPLSGLDEHLLLVMDRYPDEGNIALAYLSHSRQRWAAQSVQIELEARWLERVEQLADIGQTHRHLAAGELRGPASVLLRHFSQISQDVEAALNQATTYPRRLALSAIVDRLSTLIHELRVSSGPFVDRFQPIAIHWLQLVANHLQKLSEAAEKDREVDNPYVVGVPLTERQEIFVGRADIVARIEQLLSDQRRPPLLLYGQRRMGKTSLLRNLGRMLPRATVPLFVDGQRISLATDYPDLLYNLAAEISRSARQGRQLELPVLSRDVVAANPFSGFNEWLDAVELALERGGYNIALLALDEFEALGTVLDKGRFDVSDFLSLLRHTIQHRPRFKVMLAGSHALAEFQQWASYLINVQVIKIGYLAEDEARQLIEQPTHNFTLRYEPSASQRVLTLTRGHPALVQLLCYELVTLKNEQDIAARRLVCQADVETAASRALTSGSFFFADIRQNQINEAALTLLHALAARGEGAVTPRSELVKYSTDTAELEQALVLLQQRDLIEGVNAGYRFQVELIRRWFEE